MFTEGDQIYAITQFTYTYALLGFTTPAKRRRTAKKQKKNKLLVSAYLGTVLFY